MIQKIKNILIIIIVLIVLFGLGWIVFNIYQVKKLKAEKQKLIKTNEKIIEDASDDIAEIRSKYLSMNTENTELRNKVKYLSEKDLDNKNHKQIKESYLNLQDNFKLLETQYDTLYIEHGLVISKYDRLLRDFEKLNDAYEKEVNRPKRRLGLGCEVMGGLSGFNEQLAGNIIISPHATFNFFDNRFQLITGLYFKPTYVIEDIEAGLKLGFNINIKAF